MFLRRRTSDEVCRWPHQTGVQEGGPHRPPPQGEPERQAVLSLREHNPDAPNCTITRVVSDENPKTAWAAVRDHIQPKSVLTADEHGSYDDRVGLAILRRVKHSLAHHRGR
ncbi:transposase [Ensifer adhaerens]